MLRSVNWRSYAGLPREPHHYRLRDLTVALILRSSQNFMPAQALSRDSDSPMAQTSLALFTIDNAESLNQPRQPFPSNRRTLNFILAEHHNTTEPCTQTSTLLSTLEIRPPSLHQSILRRRNYARRGKPILQCPEPHHLMHQTTNPPHFDYYACRAIWSLY